MQMALAKLPIVPQWNLTGGSVCTPDGGFLYVAKKSINYIGPIEDKNQPPVIKCFQTRQPIKSIDVDLAWGKKVFNDGADGASGDAGDNDAVGWKKLFAVLAGDNSVQIWDFDKACAITGHKAHISQSHVDGKMPIIDSRRVLLSYMCNQNVLSLDAQDLVVYCVASNTFYRRPTFISTRSQTLVVLRCCPYKENTFAVGTSRGLVLICDLQQMQIVYTLRGHDTQITSLSWTSVEVPTIAEKIDSVHKSIKAVQDYKKSPAKPTPINETGATTGGDDMFNIYDYDYLENEFGAPPDSTIKRKSSESEFVGVEKPTESACSSKFNFVEACESLKEDIHAIKKAPPRECEEVTLADCQEKHQENLCLSDDYSHSSLSLSNQSSSGDDIDVDGERNLKVNILHQAEVHATQTLDRKQASAGIIVETGIHKLQTEEATAKVNASNEEQCEKIEFANNSKLSESSDVIEKEIKVLQTETSNEDNEIKKKCEIADVAKNCSRPNDEIEDDELNLKDEILDAVEQEQAEQSEIKENETDEEDAELDSGEEIELITTEELVKEVKSSKHMQSSTSLNSIDSKPDILLASGAVDGTFWVWNTNIGASCDTIKTRAGNTTHGKNMNPAILWFQNTNLIINDRQSELTYWTLQSTETICSHHVRRYKFKEVKHRFHLYRSAVDINISQKDAMLWCISSLREIVCEGILTKRLVAKYSCVSTNISVMLENPHNMNKIALGFSDRRVGIFDMEKITPTSVNIHNFSPRIDSQVLSMAWNADCTKLAFGTAEGRIGIINVENPKYPPFIYNPICGKPIYSIEWQNNNIFIVCNDKVAVYNENSKNKDGHYLSDIKNVSSLAICGTNLFIGTQHGHVRIYRCIPNTKTTITYELAQDLQIAARYISGFAWSPIDKEKLAVVSNTNIIQILNYKMEQSVMTYYRKIEVENLKAAHSCVKWSNVNANIFLTCGLDGDVRIWDLTNEETPLIYLKQYHCPMYCGLFLPKDENIVICAGKYTSLEFFDMRTEKTDVYSTNKFKNSPSTISNVAWAMSVVPRTNAKIQSGHERRRNRQLANKNIENGNEKIETVAETSEIAKKLTDLNLDEQNKIDVVPKSIHENVYMRDSVSILYLTAKELNVNALAKLTFILSASDFKSSKGKLLTTKLLSTKADAMQLLTEELNNYQLSNATGISTLLSPLMKGNLKEEIVKCTKNKRLSEWHVSLAPTISYSFWVKCCEAFSDQLMEQGHALQAATYMAAIHRQTDAIKILLQRNYHKEAMLIARVHLQLDDPLVNEILESWITYLDFTGNLFAAALLCTITEQMSRAYDLLRKVRNVQPEVEQVIKLLKENKHYS